MNQKERVIHRKLRIFQYADEVGHVAKACRYFGIASVYKNSNHLTVAARGMG